mmetsp:Transcript_37745/g.57798  ORF Transcript_37745/g.57798 Transcript_37745/m.57798 type:complete len:110 (+) Transcript_37745:1644-1973(+)
MVFGYYVSFDAFLRALQFGAEVDDETKAWFKKYCSGKKDFQLRFILRFITGKPFLPESFEVKMDERSLSKGTESPLPTSRICLDEMYLVKYKTYDEFMSKVSKAVMFSL